MKKIVITGGIGYIGTELCKIYSGYSWNDKITVIDNRFISERVNQLRNWNMNFVHGDILDKDLIKKYCSDADVIHHLAGITAVPRVQSEASEEKEKEIERVAKEGTQNILDVVSNTCKIIMPSTHVVYEGMKDVQEDILENEDTCPSLAYGRSKDFNEKQLKSSGKNFIILRLGSVYGYSTDTARIDIMTNLFSKISSQNGTLKLFAGGRQIKSLVPLIDVARCFKFMEEKNDIKNEIFNVTKDKITVGKRLAVWALATQYGKSIPYSGPVYKGHEIKDGQVTVSFDHVADGLVTGKQAPFKPFIRSDEAPGFFQIKGSDNAWHWADAKIAGNTVVVSNADVAEPVAVRYGWSCNPDGNLYNSAGLPAVPFRTDIPE